LRRSYRLAISYIHAALSCSLCQEIIWKTPRLPAAARIDLFNAGLGGGIRRAIDIREGETVDEAAFKALVREAVAVNVGRQGKRT